MDLFSDWLGFHRLDQASLLDIASAWRAGALGSNPALITDLVPNQPSRFTQQVPNQPSGFTQNECFESLVLPAFSDALQEPDLYSRFLNEIEFGSLSNKNACLPHTVDRGTDRPVLISLNWGGTADDVICLAHETAHALHILLSNHEQMPPVAREVCAFLGELIVIAHARQKAPNLYPALCDVWHRENETYLGSDFDALLAALTDPQVPYHYRQNYPIARLAAVELFNRGNNTSLRDFFTSGRDGMRQLPIDQMAKRAGDIVNYLPSMPQSQPVKPTIDAYRSLGAMALIDIDYWEGESQTRIDDYYAGLLSHLQNRTAFVALNEQRKPIGYATWLKSSHDKGVTLTRQAAPFGDHLSLQRALERHLGETACLTTRHNRSVKQEHVA